MPCLLLLLQPLPTLSSSSPVLLFLQNPHHVPSVTSLKKPKKILLSKPLKIPPFALTESSDSPQSIDPSPQSLLQELSVSTSHRHWDIFYIVCHVFHFPKLYSVLVMFYVFLSSGVAGLLWSSARLFPTITTWSSIRCELNLWFSFLTDSSCPFCLLEVVLLVNWDNLCWCYICFVVKWCSFWSFEWTGSWWGQLFCSHTFF